MGSDGRDEEAGSVGSLEAARFAARAVPSYRSLRMRALQQSGGQLRSAAGDRAGPWFELRARLGLLLNVARIRSVAGSAMSWQRVEWNTH